MTDRIIVTFDKSQEDIPVLISFRENQFAYLTNAPVMSAISTFTGDEAIELWNKLNNKKN